MPKPKPTTPEQEAERRAAAMRAIEEDRRALESSRRKMFTAFEMWKFCPDRRCIRQRRCAGDVERCLNERWRPLIPPEGKAFISKVLKRVADGMPMAQAIAATDVEMAQLVDAQQRLATMP
ncbi:unnamed protein product, partial [Phaeothamnion confervicola]